MRVALHTKVRADRIEEYEAAHREVPEELTAVQTCHLPVTERPARPQEAPCA